jgi:uncharacterized membrane protein HdeD (DUF308 family)
VAGFLLLTQPGTSLLSLTLVTMVYVLIDGISTIIFGCVPPRVSGFARC